MGTLDELSSVLFGNGGDEVSRGLSNGTMTMFYATATSASADGSVTIQIDDPIYSLSDQEDTESFEEVYIEESDDDAESIGYDDDDRDEEEFEYVWEDSDDEDTVEGDE